MAPAVCRPSRAQVLSATRLHFPAGTEVVPEATVKHLQGYATSTMDLGVAAAVAVNCLQAEVLRIIKEAAPKLRVQVLHVPVWGAFVPALNTLLGEAQRRGKQFILYQSLEVQCQKSVLLRMFDHFTSDTLVVGPVLDGHTFEAGEQPLNGRTTPWNTLALWCTRKLGLTGFLSVADGMPNSAQLKREFSGGDETSRSQYWARLASGDSQYIDEDSAAPFAGAMGTDQWWESSVTRTKSEAGRAAAEVPAGVEEVTAIALLQHLLGEAGARAKLLDLSSLGGKVSWKADWGGDERRKQWHEYKMASKVARPAAQIKELFTARFRNRFSASLKQPMLAVGNACGQSEDAHLHFGSVFHYGESIAPPPRVAAICLLAIALFSANFSQIFAAVFRAYNIARSAESQLSPQTAAFMGLIIGGVYLPIPVSLCLTRCVTAVADHIAGLVLCILAVLMSHVAIVLWEANGIEGWRQQVFLLCMRLLQGLGSGVLFQARFVLVSLCTQDRHQELQARMFVAVDVGLGLGALLPWVGTWLLGESELSRGHPEVLSSAMLAVLNFALLLWILAAFPGRLPRLPDRVRFRAGSSRQPAAAPAGPPAAAPTADLEAAPEDRALADHAPPRLQRNRLWQVRLLVSGTARVFVQSAALMTVALWMREADFTGQFRQVQAIAVLCFVPALAEALFSGVLPSWVPQPQERARMFAVGTAVAVLGFYACTTLGSGDIQWQTRAAGLDLLVLLVALAIAQPINCSKLDQLKDAEQTMVVLEWLKAYVGRLAGPLVAIVVQNWLGDQVLMVILCASTVLVALTA